MKRAAFALTELLVVTAIVAILGTLLFPILADQRRSASKADSLENVRAIAVGSISYASDWDDGIPVMLNGPLRSVVDVADGHLTAYGEQRTDSWPLLVTPYVKTRSTFVDPTRGDVHGIWSGPPLASGMPGYSSTRNTYRNQNRFPMYGVNYLFLSPIRLPDEAMSAAVPTDFARGESHRFAEAEDPAHTIYYTTSVRGYIPASISDTVGVLDSGHGSYAVNAPGLWVTLAASNIPYLALWNGTACGGDFCGDADMTKPGEQRRTNSVFPGNSGLTQVAFMDGHVQTMSDVDLAAGTDYLTCTPNAGATGMFGGGASIVDKSRYLWNLDSNYYGA